MVSTYGPAGSATACGCTAAAAPGDVGAPPHDPAITTAAATRSRRTPAIVRESEPVNLSRSGSGSRKLETGNRTLRTANCKPPTLARLAKLPVLQPQHPVARGREP